MRWSIKLCLACAINHWASYKIFLNLKYLFRFFGWLHFFIRDWRVTVCYYMSRKRFRVNLQSIVTWIKSSHRRCFIKKAVLKNFAILPGKHLCWSLCWRLQHRCFPVNIVKFLRTPVLKNICERLLLPECQGASCSKQVQYLNFKCK